MAAKKRRLDSLLVDRGICGSREQAKRLIIAGEVMVGTVVKDKPATEVAEDAELTVKEKPRFVGRGGLKLEGALEEFGIEAEGRVCLDVGASTGGFTDCLLQRGASRVYAFDVGTNQLAWKLRNDPRVVSREKFNVRHMVPEDIGEEISLCVIDVSFISLTLILEPVFRVLAPEGEVVALVKPQFEAPREAIGKGGIVRDEEARLASLEKVRRFVERDLEKRWRGHIDSPIAGTDGNREFLAWLTP